MQRAQETIDKLLKNNFGIQEIEQYLESPLVLVKTNAIIAVLRGNITEKRIIDKLNKICRNIQQEPKVLGEWTTAHYAMVVLELLNTAETRKIYNSNLRELGECTKESLNKLKQQVEILCQAPFLDSMF